MFSSRHPVQHSEPHTRGRGRRGFKRDSNTRERSKSHKEDLAGSENKGETGKEGPDFMSSGVPCLDA